MAHYQENFEEICIRVLDLPPELIPPVPSTLPMQLLVLFKLFDQCTRSTQLINPTSFLTLVHHTTITSLSTHGYTFSCGKPDTSPYWPNLFLNHHAPLNFEGKVSIEVEGIVTGPMVSGPSRCRVSAPSSGYGCLTHHLNLTDKKVESIPSLFQDIIERLVASQVMTVKPDACIVDFFNEGDHSQPNCCPPWFGRPVYTLFLTECDITFGRIIVSDHPGDYRGAVKLSLLPG
ncbi:hypothetical protein V8G54_016037 [Vigna mungo]|uniref:Uncharacterized protein n=1 Tax=Vigna mungo TaxID=3915 RepID=A0AAQ3RYY8_VIGMU